MGEVYLAEHKDLQTPVAVKLLNREISNNHDHVQRFFNEARVVSKIKHAGTVKIFDSGFHNDQAYLIMELLEGESLASRIEKQRALSVAQIVDIGRQVSSVLEATHRQGVIHRDLKPDNIYLVHDDERASGERVKVLDFGIAKLSGTLSIVSPKTSGTMGTPAYMAPEQWGDSANVDWRADAYSLGCVMFEMACGRPPFIAHTIAEAYTKHLTAVPPAPSSLAPGLPSVLEQLILRLLAKDPAERAVSMGQVTRELAELAGEPLPAEQRRPHESGPVIAVPPSATTLGGSAAELQPRPRPRPVLIAGIVGVAVAMVALVIVMMAGKDTSKAKEPTPTAHPSVPAPVVEQAPAPVPAPPPAPPPPARVETPAAGSAAGSAVAVTTPEPPAPAAKPAKKPLKPKQPKTGSAATPASGDDDFGGRL